jgi:hypothetical protein
MNLKMHWNHFPRYARIFAALVAGVFLIPALHAQPTEQTVQNRLLLVFDTSSDMRKRVPAVQKALNAALLTMSIGEQLHSGDSIGVWTFDQDLRTGEFPLQNWDSDKAAKIGEAITKFIGKQHYTKTTSFGVLQPLLNRVVENSERLTVLIFCDGESTMGGTPFDDGINQALTQKQAEQKTAEEPIVILFRSQLGKYTGCTVSLPPAPANIPPFPPLPKPPLPAPKLTNAAPPVPHVVGTPIILIGKKVETNLPPPLTNPLPTNPPPTNPPAAPVNQTNPPAAPTTNPVAANTITIMVAPTNMPALSPEVADSGGKKNLLVGGSLLGAAAALGVVVWLRARRKDSSLITRSMNNRR